MRRIKLARLRYRREELANVLTHGFGTLCGIAATGVLVTLAALRGDVFHIVGAAVFGTTLVVLYSASTLYHAAPSQSVKARLRVVDHSAIYLLIAGTYTPFTLVALKGTLGWWMFGAIWGLAVFGMILDALPRKGSRVVPVIIYLVMGWLCVFALGPIVAVLPPDGFGWLLAGGILYTSGIVFFVLDHWYPWCHEIWHLFVIAGSASHYFSILLLY